MFPNPHDALPLPPRPSVERYRKLAKDLVKACRSSDPEAISGWADRWIESLSDVVADASGPRDPRRIDRAAGQVEDAVLARHGSVADASLSWYGETPRKKKA